MLVDSSNIAGPATIGTGSGEDTIELRSSRFFGVVNVHAGAEADRVLLASASGPLEFSNRVLIDGGSGSDTLELTGSPIFAHPGDPQLFSIQ